MRHRTALFVGRFQPLHNGHVHAVRHLLERYQRVVVGIGSINQHGPQNPFSFLLRKRMLEAVFGEEIRSKRLRIIGLADVHDDARWTRKLLKRARFDAVVTGNPDVRRCLKRFPVSPPRFYRRSRCSATRIRRLMETGGPWQRLVPPDVRPLLRKTVFKSARTT